MEVVEGIETARIERGGGTKGYYNAISRLQKRALRALGYCDKPDQTPRFIPWLGKFVRNGFESYSCPFGLPIAVLTAEYE